MSLLSKLFGRVSRHGRPLLKRFSARLEGADAVSWLQGQVTCDVTKALGPDFHPGFICNRMGQVQAIVHFRMNSNGIDVVGEKASLFVLRESVKTYVVMEDVRFDLLDETPKFYALNKETLTLSENPPDEAFAIEANDDLYEVYEMDRLIEGLPDDRDLIGKLFPAEFGAKVERCFVSYAKGCYIGQEVVHRMHDLGAPSKLWRLLEISDTEIPDQSRIVNEGRDVGFITTHLEIERYTIARGFVRKDVSELETLEVNGASATLMVEHN